MDNIGIEEEAYFGFVGELGISKRLQIRLQDLFAQIYAIRSVVFEQGLIRQLGEFLRLGARVL